MKLEDDMEHIIAKLLHDFEHGYMSRRQLIQSLAMAATAAAASGTAPAAAAAPDAKGFKAVAVNHISFQVADYGKTRDFYANLLGMKVLKDTGRQCNLAFGDQGFDVERFVRRVAAEGRSHCVHDRELGQGCRRSRTQTARAGATARHAEQLPCQGSGRLRRSDQRQGDDAGQLGKS